MSTSPDDLEQRAERAVRRGELLVALELFDAVLAQHPEDERVRLRMESVRALLQPSELVHRRRAEPEETAPGLEPLSDAEEGELHAASGRFAEATAAYQRAVSCSPDNALLCERLAELEQLAPPDSRAVDDGLAAAPRLEGAARADLAGSSPRALSDAGSSRAARAADSAFRPLEVRQGSAPPPAAKTAALPSDAVEMLQTLLTRIRGGRRSKHADA